MPLVPETVILEKLFPVLVMVALALEVADVVKIIVEPVAPVLAKPATILLLFTVCVPMAGKATLFEINVTVPVVLTDKLVKVLPLIFCDKVADEFEMYVCTLLPATECTTPRMSLF